MPLSIVRLALAAVTLGSVGAIAQTNLPPAQGTGPVAAPVEIVATMAGDRVQCEPPQARFPASDEIDLRLINRSDQQVTISAPRLLVEQQVVRFEGAVAHSASDQGYVVKPGGLARLIVRTPPPGDYAYSCTAVQERGTPFRGMLTIVPKAQ